MSGSIFDTELQYYPANVRIPEPMGLLTLGDILKAIKSPKSKTKKIFEQIREASENGDVELKKTLKEQLYYFTPCVTTDGDGRSYSNLFEFTGLMVFEFDKVDFAKELKQYIFDNLKCVIAAFLSPSGNGCKFIAKIPQASTIYEYKQYYCGLSYYLHSIQGYDIANYNPLLPLFLTYDPDILIREDAETWCIRGVKNNSMMSNSKVVVKDPNCNTEFNKNIVRGIVCNKIDSIFDNGHPQVLRIATVLGGFVGYGYLSEYEAVDIISECINRNSYLSKDVRGYIRTAKQMISKGANKPLKLKL